jgi:hypothetical protein
MSPDLRGRVDHLDHLDKNVIILILDGDSLNLVSAKCEVCVKNFVSSSGRMLENVISRTFNEHWAILRDYERTPRYGVAEKKVQSLIILAPYSSDRFRDLGQ